ncbi:MAG: efflux transporter periplasmic adaptor subunit [Sphingomonas sp. SCN 67-18]|uniref:efflux RND transporter periplasmic adaptor subunit n=1 Tax=uncultured Sphingomonas sp. TaxID=158754 RepID=UPI000868A0AB|nr:efflux RND transporter periplasmic adaptor subunit [Sphingomonas sp. SCN 67-18]ODU20336.1 MAG: efflux transporter periplasmic adaptor subunit [Sphingomonas sp. SCN 67-18]
MNYESSFSHDEAGAVALDETQRNRRRRNIIIGAVVAVIVLAAAYALFGRGGGAAEAGKADQQRPHVTVIVPTRQPVDRVLSATGSLAARREMPVGVVGEGGMVTRVLVEPGQWVGAGQVLATIERSVQAEQNNSLSAQINVARADARIAQAELDRSMQLVARGFISKADVDRKTATRDAAAARVRVAEAQLGESRARTGRLDIRAPAAGLVLTRAVEPGQVVGAGSGVLFRMAKGGEMELRAQLNEMDLATLRAGVAAQVTPVGSDRSFDGQVWQVSPVIDPDSRQGVARIALSYDPALRPGGFATARIVAGSVDAPLLPESSIQSDQKGSFLYVVDKNDTIVRRDVKVGNVSDGGITILSGLSNGERVVLSAGAFLNPGDKVVPERRATR